MVSFFVIDNIRKVCLDKLVLDDISFELKIGEVLALIGAGGSDKTTLAKILSGIDQPDRGEIWLQDKPLDRRSPLHAYWNGATYLPADARVFELLMRTFRPFRQIYCVGNNVMAAQRVGISVNWIRLALYPLAGVLAAVAGIWYSDRAGTAPLSLGLLFDVRLLAVALLGGDSLRDGRGSVLGGLLAGMVIILVLNAVDQTGLPVIFQNITLAGLFFLSLIINRQRP